MKAKFVIVLTALLMLVGSVCAQVNNQTPKRAGSETPLKGDVNGDGVVDVADIAAIIEIMKNGGETAGETLYYWYVGPEKPTSLSQATVVASYPSEYTYTSTNSEAKTPVYVLTNKDKIVTMYDPAMPTIALKTAEDISTIPGYKITYLSADGITPAKIARNGKAIIKVSDK